ncbi:unnamed protein product [Caenorhabditis brenneri]
MTTRGFPLLHLPLLCIDCILQQFEIVDTIDFSTISKKCYRIVNFLPRPFKTANIEMRCDWLHILFKTENAVCGQISFDKRGLAFLFKQDKSFDWKNGPTKHIFKSADGDPEPTIRKMIPYLTSMFKCNINRVLLFSDNLPSDSIPCFSIPGFTQCEILRIRGGSEISNVKLQCILEQITVKRELVLDVPTNIGFKLERGADEIRCIFKAEWFSIDILKQLNPKSVALYDCHWSVNDCVQFITHWFNSNNTTFESLELCFKTYPGDVNLEHLNTLPFCKTRRSEHALVVPRVAYKCINGLDILRSDGLLATVEMKDGHFLFYVFHERFSDVSKATIHDL